MSSRLAAFLTPRSIALVGCPGDLTRPGARPLVYLRQHGYAGNEGLLVQRMVSGVEVLVGVTREATFGPLLVIGAGGRPG